MEAENTSSTQGSDQSGYIPVSPKTDTKKESTSIGTQNSSDKFGIQYIKPLIESLQDNLAFSAVLLNIIGYIIISSFGQMDNIGAYARYVIFLLLNFILYKFLGKNKIEIGFKNINLFLSIGFLILLFFILIEHNIFTLVYSNIVNIISKK